MDPKRSWVGNVLNMLIERRHKDIEKPSKLEYDNHSTNNITIRVIKSTFQSIPQLTLYADSECHSHLGKVLIHDILIGLKRRYRYMFSSVTTNNNNTHPQILFICHKITIQAVHYLRIHLPQDTYSILSINDISVPRTRNKLVSQYHILNEEEIKRVEHKYSSTRENFPKLITPIDPIVRYLGFKVGQVIQVTRRCNQNGYEIIYRYVTKTTQ